MVIERTVEYNALAGANASTYREADPFRAAPRNTTRVALVHLGNTGGLGTTRRVAVWRELLSAGSSDVVEINLLHEHRRRLPSLISAGRSLNGTLAAESAMWSIRSPSRALKNLDRRRRGLRHSPGLSP